MKQTSTRAVRIQSQAERGLSAQRLMDDEFIQAWFENYRHDLVSKMLSAKIEDDQTRRNAAVEIATLDAMRRHIESEAALGKRASQEIEKERQKT